jgi:transcriptional regulator with XRE-family HTH domain
MKEKYEEQYMDKQEQQGGTDQQLGDYIGRRRAAMGWTLDDAERASGVDRTYWNKVERGKFKKPDPRYLAQMAAALDAPLADVYGLAGFTTPQALPSFRPYLRSKYYLPPEAIEQLEGYFAFLRNQYGIQQSEPVFPPRQDSGSKDKKRPAPEPEGGAWADPTLGDDPRSDRKAA